MQDNKYELYENLVNNNYPTICYFIMNINFTNSVFINIFFTHIDKIKYKKTE